jgi:hypothetical protein
MGRGIIATGGKLELSKCFYYLCAWNFNDEGIATMKETIDGKIEIIDSETKETYEIPNKATNKSHKTLGVLETPNGDYTDEISRLREKSDKFAQRMATAILQRKEVAMAYHQVYLPSMNYSAVSGVLSEQVANSVQTGMAKQCLSRLGFNRHVPNAIVYGPKEIGGIGFNHLFSAQGSAKTCFIIQMIRSNRPAGAVIRSYLTWAQQVAGTSKPILMDVHNTLPQLGGEIWLTTLREYLHKSDLQIQIQDLFSTKLACANDEFIMDIVMRNITSTSDIVKINRCRILLKATTIADITDPSGRVITDDAFNCSREAQIDSTSLWPIQPHVGKDHIKAWQRFIRTICKVNSRSLETPLGDWASKQINHTTNHNAFYDDVREEIMIEEHGFWTRHLVEEKRKFCIAHPTNELVECIDKRNMIPISIEKANGRIKATWRKRRIASKTNVATIDVLEEQNDWDDFTRTLPEWEQVFLKTRRFITTNHT